MASVLVLGGIRSGKSEFAESLVTGEDSVRYLATARDNSEDPDWSARLQAHRDRRPDSWTTEELPDPAALATAIGEAGEEDTLLIDDLGLWLAGALDAGAATEALLDDLIDALGRATARLVIVSPEVGLTVVPDNVAGRRFADQLGRVNQRVAAASDAVALVVAGEPLWLKQSTAATRRRPAGTSATLASAPAVDAAGPVAVVAAAAATESDLDLSQALSLPLPDEEVGTQASARLGTLDAVGRDWGGLHRLAAFAGSTQATPAPVALDAVRVILLHGNHCGGLSAGADLGAADTLADRSAAGDGPLAALAGQAGAALQVVRLPSSAAVEDGDAIRDDEVVADIRYGWQLADAAADSGVAALVLAATGAGAVVAATATVCAANGGEAASLLGRVVTADGRVDDAAWMTRCATVRDALRRLRQGHREARSILAALGGHDLAVAVGVILGAASRKTPVFIDGPVGSAAALLARDFGGQVRHWLYLADAGTNPVTQLGADILNLTPLLNLKLDLAEGVPSLLALPFINHVLRFAAIAPVTTVEPAELQAVSG